MKNPEFKVRRVSRYRVPKYPSHLEPDPTLHPRPVAFPWKYGVVAAWLGLSAVGCGQQDKVAGAKAADPGNPFAMKKKDASGERPLNGLPHQTSPYGTGAPSYVNDAEAVKLIRKIFKEQGFPLQENVQFSADGIEFQADGYDPKHKVGFVFVNYQNYGAGMLDSWRDRALRVDAGLEEQILAAKTQSQFKEILQRAAKDIGPEAAAALKETMTAQNRPNPKEILEKYSELWAAHLQNLLQPLNAGDRAKLLAKEKMTLSMAEAGVLEKMETKDQTFIAVVSQFDDRFCSMGYGLNSASLSILNENHDPAEVSNPKPEHTPLGQLERAVREYIAWARRNGLQ